jgi:hypothetical protein
MVASFNKHTLCLLDCPACWQNCSVYRQPNETPRIAPEKHRPRQPTKSTPHLLTVAGDATARSSTSNIIVIDGVMVMISPDTRHSFLLSSRTGRWLGLGW